uniref:Ig-like domain-containing protein n=1 Tax=Timema douglasi TaxID=61478 RepID=A0A7R8Z5L8_TIMDO|nr:unnamed protein product [Timema douglasi]
MKISDKSIVLMFAVRPLWVRLLGDNLPLSADNTYELQCEAVGARPAPSMSWWKGSSQLRNTRELGDCEIKWRTYSLTWRPGIPHIHKLGLIHEVKEGFGNQINLRRNRGLNPGPPPQKSDTFIPKPPGHLNM